MNRLHLKPNLTLLTAIVALSLLTSSPSIAQDKGIRRTLLASHSVQMAPRWQVAVTT